MGRERVRDKGVVRKYQKKERKKSVTMLKLNKRGTLVPCPCGYCSADRRAPKVERGKGVGERNVEQGTGRAGRSLIYS
jgi:hypothetical protein